MTPPQRLSRLYARVPPNVTSGAAFTSLSIQPRDAIFTLP